MSQHTAWPALDRYARDLLDGPDRFAIEAHVHECDDCARRVRRLREEETALRQALAPEDADEEAAERVVRAALAAAPPAAPPPRRAGGFLPLAAAAALFAAVLAITLELPKAPPVDPVASAIGALQRGEPGAEAALERIGRKCLPELRQAEGPASGAARERLAACRARIERALPRVLWVEARPRYEFRHLEGLLRDDRSFLVQTLQLEESRSKEPTWCVQFPFRVPIRNFPAQELADYDAVMLGDLRMTTDQAIRALDAFVTSYGGGVLMIAGEQSADALSAHTMCASLSPVEVRGASAKPAFVRLTPAGKAHEATAVGGEYFEARELRWYQQVQAKPGATVLVETRAGAPLLTVWTRGRGRVAHLASDDHWYWRGEQAAYYRAILNWLARR